jgi:hypothetical protein
MVETIVKTRRIWPKASGNVETKAFGTMIYSSSIIFGWDKQLGYKRGAECTSKTECYAQVLPPVIWLSLFGLNKQIYGIVKQDLFWNRTNRLTGTDIGTGYFWLKLKLDLDLAGSIGRRTLAIGVFKTYTTHLFVIPNFNSWFPATRTPEHTTSFGDCFFCGRLPYCGGSQH